MHETIQTIAAVFLLAFLFAVSALTAPDETKTVIYADTIGNFTPAAPTPQIQQMPKQAPQISQQAPQLVGPREFTPANVDAGEDCIQQLDGHYLHNEGEPGYWYCSPLGLMWHADGYTCPGFADLATNTISGEFINPMYCFHRQMQSEIIAATNPDFYR